MTIGTLFYKPNSSEIWIPMQEIASHDENKSIHVYNGVLEYVVMHNILFCYCYWGITALNMKHLPMSCLDKQNSSVSHSKEVFHWKRCQWFACGKESWLLCCWVPTEQAQPACHLVSLEMAGCRFVEWNGQSFKCNHFSGHFLFFFFFCLA